jgi:photosystem II stability/assembly factor-like uncharacterized protein
MFQHPRIIKTIATRPQRWPLLAAIAIATIVLSGCSIRFNNQQPVSTAGIFKSADSATSWTPHNLFLHSGGSGSMDGVNVLDLSFDPQDFDAIYLNSESSGLLYSYDAGSSWQQAVALGNTKIEAVVIDPRNKCVIYVTAANTIRKSVDCSRTYAEVYIDTRADKVLTALAIDSFNNLVVYAGNTVGDILKSFDGGATWQVIHRIPNQLIRTILIDPNDTRIIYVATQNNGIYKTTNAGADWADINDGLRQFSSVFDFRDLMFDSSQRDSLLLVSKYGLLKTTDGGGTWEPFQLITPPTSVDIFAAAINPQNNREFYYATASTFYKTVDGGENWITTRLPSASRPATLLIDPRQPNVIYMGMYGVSQ